MADVAFTGNCSNTGLWFGGITGSLQAINNEIILKNCANYGSVIYSGSNKGNSPADIGGIAGLSYADSTYIVNIQNCLNYGTIALNGETGYTYTGGILGCIIGGESNAENCVSAGKISIVKPAADSNWIGYIVGSIDSGSFEGKHCYWTSEVGSYDGAYGQKRSGTTVNIDSETSSASLNTSTMSNLNSYSSGKGWDRWFMLHLNGGAINGLNQKALIVTEKHFPEPEKGGNTFMFWCLDVDCNEKYDPKSTDMTKVTDLYAQWTISSYTVTFDYGNGTVIKETVKYNTSINYPANLTREGYTFNGWSPSPEMMPAHDITVVAQWTEDIVSEFVEVVFDAKSMTDDEIKAVLKNITDEEFTIEEVTTDNTGEIKVIIKFNDPVKASDFVRKVNEGRKSNIIKRANTVPPKQDSFTFRSKITLTTIALALLLCY